VAVSTSCSLLHVPVDRSAETRLAPELFERLAFARQKVDEVVLLGGALRDGTARPPVQPQGSPEAWRNGDVRDRLAALSPADRQRGSYPERAAAQQDRLRLPELPTTTIGSFPQTAELRKARAELRDGRLGADGYAARMRAEVEHVIRLQEALGLDVLVHGEPERNDMVQYFGERLDGFAATDHGWVQSYGSRCVRPPLLYGDVARREPMTVEWAAYAQSLTAKPVKGMLTGPVTILAWSFVRTDQPLADTADQVALALRDEAADLEAAGIRVIQVDEPALRELLPLRYADQKSYLDWAVGAFRLATSGVADDTQIHTHLCYSEFGEVITAIDALDADVTSIEASRSKMEVLGDLAAAGYRRGVGPGVWDIHSPRVPSQDEIVSALRRAVAAVPARRLWVNPDCGLKTRGYPETEASLRRLVAAATEVRTA
jgi:5-methyltetrahydropteroyltriglutamate--homocysteine methyltransferase